LRIAFKWEQMGYEIERDSDAFFYGGCSLGEKMSRQLFEKKCIYVPDDGIIPPEYITDNPYIPETFNIGVVGGDMAWLGEID